LQVQGLVSGHIATGPDTLSLDNGGDSGHAYWANRSAQQLPGPFTPAVSIGLPPTADSLDPVPELLVLFAASVFLLLHFKYTTTQLICQEGFQKD